MKTEALTAYSKPPSPVIGDPRITAMMILTRIPAEREGRRVGMTETLTAATPKGMEIGTTTTTRTRNQSRRKHENSANRP